MYVPHHFTETREDRLHALIRAHPLGLLISSSGGAMMADPVPFLLDTAGKRARLLAHVARANPQWMHIRDGARVLVVFQGAESYVSPAWYPSKGAHGKVVPTWNYAMVQVDGTATVHEDPAWLKAQVSALTDIQEAGRREPWAVSDAPERFIDAQMRGIVGIEIAVTAMTGKWKASQNRSAEDRAGVKTGLMAQGDHVMAGLVPADGKADRGEDDE